MVSRHWTSDNKQTVVPGRQKQGDGEPQDGPGCKARRGPYGSGWIPWSEKMELKSRETRAARVPVTRESQPEAKHRRAASGLPGLLQNMVSIRSPPGQGQNQRTG